MEVARELGEALSTRTKQLEKALLLIEKYKQVMKEAGVSYETREDKDRGNDPEEPSREDRRDEDEGVEV